MAESRPGTTKGLIMDNGFQIKMGIEIGGTFTDLILLDEHGIAHIEKVLSTPEDLTEGAINGFQKLLQTNKIARQPRKNERKKKKREKEGL